MDEAEYSLCRIPFDKNIRDLLSPTATKLDNDLDKLAPILPLILVRWFLTLLDVVPGNLLRLGNESAKLYTKNKN